MVPKNITHGLGGMAVQSMDFLVAESCSYIVTICIYDTAIKIHHRIRLYTAYIICYD